jgi:hypothetical protein
MNLTFFNICDNGITFQPIFQANLNHLPCAACKKFIKWVSGSEFAAIASQLNKGGQI